jgi:hypothetical protein
LPNHTELRRFSEKIGCVPGGTGSPAFFEKTEAVPKTEALEQPQALKIS